MSHARASDAFEAARGRLTRLAYRMLGQWSEAEDVVQDAGLRWIAIGQEAVKSADAWLTTVTVRLAIDRLRRSKAAREVYPGPWVPEPIVTEVGDAQQAESLAEDLSIGLLLTLERLGPEERAAFILREAFDTPYADIAATLAKTEAAVRQLVTRARQRMAAGRARFHTDAERHGAMLAALISAVQAGDKTRLTQILAADAVMLSDAGGKRPAALRPIHGADAVALLILALGGASRAPRVVRPIVLNGAPALWIVDALGHEGTLQIETDGQRIHAIHIVRNPDKIAHLNLGQSQSSN